MTVNMHPAEPIFLVSTSDNKVTACCAEEATELLSTHGGSFETCHLRQINLIRQNTDIVLSDNVRRIAEKCGYLFSGQSGA